MIRFTSIRIQVLVIASVSLGVATGSLRAADDVVGITAISSKASKDYVRAKLPDGSYEQELYAFGEGGFWGSEINDRSVEKMHFMDVARIIAPPLAKQNYLSGRNPKKTKLLIMVYWGTTAVPSPAEEDPLYYNYEQSIAEYNTLMSESRESNFKTQLIDEANSVLTAGLRQLSLANHKRDLIDFRNASMLGYDSDGLVGTDYGKYIEHTALGLTQRDEVTEIEENRYFVVLMAYDFQLLWKEKKHRLLWETRFSINERHNQFDVALPVMALEASKYFGQDTKGLVRKDVPNGRVDIGEVKSLGEASAPQK